MSYSMRDFSCLEDLSTEQRHLSAPLSQRDRKDLERVRLLEQKSGWIQNEFVHDGSVKHPYTSFYPTSSSPKPPRQADRWAARAAAEWFCRGWVGDIDSVSTVHGREKGPAVLFLQG